MKLSEAIITIEPFCWLCARVNNQKLDCVENSQHPRINNFYRQTFVKINKGKAQQDDPINFLFCRKQNSALNAKKEKDRITE